MCADLYRFKNLQTRLNKLIYANRYLKHAAKKFQKPYIPVYDKTKKEIISMSAGKSVDINHGQHRKLKLNRIMGRENWFKYQLTRLNKQANLCNLQSYKHVAINFK